MASVSGGMLFLNGLGAISGPILTGWLMTIFGPPGFWVFIAVLLLVMTLYAAYRTTQRPAPSVEETSAYAPVMMSASPVAVEAAQEWAVETAEAEAEAGEKRTEA